MDPYAQFGIGATALWSHRDLVWSTVKLDSESRAVSTKKARDKGKREISLEELEEHRAGDSIWVAVEGKVWE